MLVLHHFSCRWLQTAEGSWILEVLSLLGLHQVCAYFLMPIINTKLKKTKKNTPRDGCKSGCRCAGGLEQPKNDTNSYPQATLLVLSEANNRGVHVYLWVLGGGGHYCGNPWQMSNFIIELHMNDARHPRHCPAVRCNNVKCDPFGKPRCWAVIYGPYLLSPSRAGVCI